MNSPQPLPEGEAYKLMSLGKFAEALPWAEKAVAARQTCTPAFALLATLQLRTGRLQDAENTVQRALQMPGASADALDGLAFVSLQLGQHERANTLYRKAVEWAPNTGRFWYNLASSERSFGRLSEAEAACDRAIALDPTHYPTFLLRSELRVQSDANNHIDALQTRLSQPGVDDRARVFLGYALAKELDDVRRFDEAFPWFAMAAQTRRRHLSYDVATDERKLQRIAEVFSEPQPHTPVANASANHLFIIGLPRSGTTLVERILSALPTARSNGETDHFARALMSAAPPGNGDVFQRAAEADPKRVAAAYESFANAKPGESVIEKLPMNYLYVGAIHRALPNAKIVLVRRDPLDSCFAMYRTLFGEAYPFSYDFQDLARYYAAYERLMNHWRAMLPGALHEVVYEDLVREPSTIAPEIAAHCGLTWHDGALEVHKNAAVSLTASAAQVRRPIYGSSSGRWRHYRVHLQPLIRMLKERGVSVPDAALT